MRIAMKICLGLTALAGIGFVASDALAKYEEPSYRVFNKEGDCELRDYPKVVAASVEVSGTRKEGANTAFKILAGYIFGKNVSQKKIAMTVPVTEKVSEKIAMTTPVTTEESASSMKMTFFMPSKYSLENLPKPLDDRIRFSEVDSKYYAVVRFSGFADEKAISENTSKLRTYMQKVGTNAVAEPVCAFYNPPWTLPFLRRNEVWIEISKPAISMSPGV